MDLCATPAVELARLIRARELSAAELLAAALARIAEVNSGINAIVTLAAEQASATAAGLDARRPAARSPGHCTGCRSRSRTWPKRPGSGPRSARPFSLRSCRPVTRRTWLGSGRPARWY